MQDKRQKTEGPRQRTGHRNRIAHAAIYFFCLLTFRRRGAAPRRYGPAAAEFCLSSGGGQALVEFIVAIVAMIALVIGASVLNRIEWSHTQTMTKAREAAGEQALGLIYQGPLDVRFISDWETGGDGIRYTHDDEAVVDGAAPALIANLVANAELEGEYSIPTNSISRLDSAPTPVTEFYLVKGKESMTVDLSAIPAFGRLISGAPEISVESQAWLVWAGGIY